MESRMPNEFINQIHRLASIEKKYEAITFTDTQENVLHDQSDDDNYVQSLTMMDTGGDTNNAHYQNIEQDSTEETEDSTEETEEEMRNDERDGDESTTIYHVDTDHTTIDMGMTRDIAKDTTSDDNATSERLTIEEINITTETNTLQMVAQDQEETDSNVPTHV